MSFLSAVGGFVSKHASKTFFAWLLFCCSPLLVFLLVIGLLEVDPFRWVPMWSDEAGW